MAKNRSHNSLIFTAIAATALLSLATYGCQSKGSTPPVSTPEGQPPPAPTFADEPPRTLMVVVDKTQSGSEEALSEFVTTLKSGITASNLKKIIVVNVGADGRGSWNAPAREFPLPTKPSDNYAKELLKLKEAVATKCGRRRNCEQRELTAADAELRARIAGEEHGYQLTYAQEIDRVVLAILQSPEKEPDCTNLSEMAERIFHAPVTHVVWLTDGDHTCKTPLTGQPFKNRVLLGLLPLAQEADGHFGKRLALLQSTFADAQIEPITALDDQAIVTFLKS